jgi:CTP synthase
MPINQLLKHLVHAGAENLCQVDVEWIHSESLQQDNLDAKLSGLNGMIVAPGFGHRGMSGKILAAKYARENNIPYLGICLGMQVAVIEFARNVLNLQGADSTEMNPKTHLSGNRPYGASERDYRLWWYHEAWSIRMPDY